jgi:hypothetical protein
VGVVELEHGVRRVLAEPPVGRRSSSDEVQVQNVPVMAVVEVVVGGGNDTRSGGWVGSTIPARGYGESHVVSRYGIVRPTEWCSEAAGALAQLGDDERAMRPAGGRLTAARAFGAPRVLARSLRAAGRVVGGDEDLGLLGRAVSAVEASPARLEHADALADLGAELVDQRRRREAGMPCGGRWS